MMKNGAFAISAPAFAVLLLLGVANDIRALEKFVVSRDDSAYQCFPDLVRTKSGTLVLTYRESGGHGPKPFSRVIVRRSMDSGKTWSNRNVLIAKNATKGEGHLNCPRLVAMKDSSLVLVIDYFPVRESITEDTRLFLYRSMDDGVTWQGPETTAAHGIVPSIKQLSDGTLLLGLTRHTLKPHLFEEQTVWRSIDNGKTWTGPAVIPQPENVGLNEGDFVELDDGKVLLIMRDDTEGLSGWKSISADRGQTWSPAWRAELFSCRGRPAAGRLQSGELVVTFRMMVGQTPTFALFVQSQADAVRQPSADSNRYRSPFPPVGRFAVLDIDRHDKPDCGYSGWVAMPDGSLFVVTYIKDDAPMAQIRGYRVTKRDWSNSTAPGSK